MLLVCESTNFIYKTNVRLFTQNLTIKTKHLCYKFCLTLSRLLQTTM